MKEEKTVQNMIDELELSRKIFEESIKSYMNSAEYKNHLERARRKAIKGPKKKLDL